MAFALQSPISWYPDLDGSPLDDGYIYIGQVNQNPITAPANVWWDAAKTQPAAQPIRTTNGYPMRFGAPAFLFTDDVSVLVLDKRGRQCLYAGNSADFSNASQLQAQLTAYIAAVANTASAIEGANLVGIFDAANNFTGTTVEAALAELALRYYGANVLRYGADPTGVADSTAAFVAAAATGRIIYGPAGTYAINWIPTSKYILHGDGSQSTFIKPFNTATAAITHRNGAPFWTYHSEVRNVCFLGTGKVGVGFTFGQTVPSAYVAGNESFNNVKFYGVLFTGLDKGIQFPFGNIGTEFYSCGFTGNRYGVYTLNNKFSATLMHAGNKYFYAGQFDNNDCGIYCHNTALGFGGISFRDTIFERNRINGYFYSDNSQQMALLFDGVWNEGSGLAIGGSTTIDQWAGTVLSTASFTNHTWIFDGSGGTYEFKGGGTFGDINLISPNATVYATDVQAEASSGNNGGPCLVANATSSIVLRNPSTGRGVTAGPRTLVEGYIKPNSLSAAADAGTRWALFAHRNSKGATYGGNGIAQRFTAGVNTTSLVVAGALVADTSALLYGSVNEYAVPGATGGSFASVPASGVTPTAIGTWLVATFMVKWVSGVAPVFFVGDLSTNQTGANMTPPIVGEWYTLGCIAQTLAVVGQGLQFAGNASASTFRISAFQLRNFASRYEAEAFLASGVYAE